MKTNNKMIMFIGAMMAITTGSTVWASDLPPPPPMKARMYVTNTAIPAIFWKGGTSGGGCSNPMSRSSEDCSIFSSSNYGTITFINGANPNNTCQVDIWNMTIQKVTNQNNESTGSITCTQTGGDAMSITSN